MRRVLVDFVAANVLDLDIKEDGVIEQSRSSYVSVDDPLRLFAPDKQTTLTPADTSNSGSSSTSDIALRCLEDVIEGRNFQQKCKLFSAGTPCSSNRANILPLSTSAVACLCGSEVADMWIH